MRICLIPMKPLAGAKARLGPALSPDERRRLSLAMLSDVVAAAVGAIERVWVLQSDPDAASVAAAAHATAVPDPAPGQGLNASLDAATRSAIDAGATQILIVAADLPAATTVDLEALMIGDDGVALTADAAGTGTNALWRSPGEVIPAAFGPASRAAHQTLALSRGVPFRIVERPRLAADVDTATGLAAAWALGVGPETLRVIEEMGLPSRLRPAG